ncbi:hypothetical protein [Streptomyces sp. NPDC054838]
MVTAGTTVVADPATPSGRMLSLNTNVMSLTTQNYLTETGSTMGATPGR